MSHFKVTCHATNRAGVRCGRPPCIGKKVCYMHGGARGSGGRLKHGRYAKALKATALSEAYQQAIQDASLLDLQEPIALLEACLQRTGERVAQADTPDFRRKAKDMWEALSEANASGDAEAQNIAMRDLGILLRDGALEDRAISELSIQAERLAKRVEAVWQIRMQRRQNLNMQQVGVLIARVLEIVKEECPPAIAQNVVNRMEVQVLKLSAQGHDVEPAEVVEDAETEPR